jgi:hypothetical protein
MSIQISERDAPARWRWAAGLGIAFAVLYALAFVVISGNQPSLTASPAHVVNFYNSHNHSSTVAAIAAVLAAVAFGFFAAGVQGIISATGDRSRQLATAVTIGAAVFSSGLLFMAAAETMLVDAAHHHQDQVAQVLNYVATDDFFPTIGGLAIFMLAAGIAVIRAAALPSWLGWVVTVVGGLALCGPLGGIAFLLAPVVVLVAAITMLVAPGRAGVGRAGLGGRPEAAASVPS